MCCKLDTTSTAAANLDQPQEKITRHQQDSSHKLSPGTLLKSCHLSISRVLPKKNCNTPQKIKPSVKTTPQCLEQENAHGICVRYQQITYRTFTVCVYYVLVFRKEKHPHFTVGLFSSRKAEFVRTCSCLRLKKDHEKNTEQEWHR